MALSVQNTVKTLDNDAKKLHILLLILSYYLQAVFLL